MSVFEADLDNIMAERRQMQEQNEQLMQMVASSQHEVKMLSETVEKLRSENASMASKSSHEGDLEQYPLAQQYHDPTGSAACVKSKREAYKQQKHFEVRSWVPPRKYMTFVQG